MPLYRYTARTLAGEPRTGTKEAQDKILLARILREQGLLLIDAERTDIAKNTAGELFERFRFFGGVPFSEKMIFARYLGVMIQSGIDLPRAMDVMAQQAQSSKFRAVLLSLGQEIRKGTSFSDALSMHPDVFPELFVSMIAVGEESGQLEEVLGILADQMEKEHTLRSRIRGAMVYPSIVVLVMFGVGIFMLMSIVPQLASVYRDAGVTLPPMTQVVIGTGEFLQRVWFLIPVFLILLVVLFRIFAASSFGKRAIAATLLRFPIFSGLVQKVAAAQTARTLGSLVEAGVPIVRGINITASTLGNYYFRTSLERAAAVVQKGTPLHKALAQDSKLWPILLVELFAVGEETGKLGEVLAKIALFYEAEVENTTRNLSTIIEPLLMVVIGIVVGFFAVSMLQPMYSLVGAIQ